MPNGEANFTGNILEMMHVNRHTTGHYRCTADNRVGQPDNREIFVNVLCKSFSNILNMYVLLAPHHLPTFHTGLINKTSHRTLHAMVMVTHIKKLPHLYQCHLGYNKILFTSYITTCNPIHLIIWKRGAEEGYKPRASQLSYWKMCPFGHDKFKISYFILTIIIIIIF
jgi:hypothetical protein